MKQIKATEILNKVQQNIRTIKNDWAIIRTNIDHNTSEICDYDLPNVLKDIKRLAKEQVNYKLMSVCINMGLTSVEQLSKNNSYAIIYELSELESQARELRSLLERKKRTGKHIESLIKDSTLQKELETIEKTIASHKAFLDEFNNSKVLLTNEVA